MITTTTCKKNYCTNKFDLNNGKLIEKGTMTKITVIIMTLGVNYVSNNINNLKENEKLAREIDVKINFKT